MTQIKKGNPMKNIFFALITMSTSVFADTLIICTEGDYETSIQITDQQATVTTCNTDWSCYGQTTEIFNFSAESSDSSYSRYVSENKENQLEVSTQASNKKEIEVKINKQKLNSCYVQ